MVNIAFTGGGTGGHIFPGLAVAAELKKMLTDQDFRLFWIGSASGMDRGIVEDAGIEFFGIPSGKLRRYFSLRTIMDFFRVIAGFFAARKILKKQKAFLLFSKGGFVSVPPCAAASSLKIPVFTHESDFSPGLATRLNARSALRSGGRIFTAYNETGGFFPEAVRDHITVCGNPVRAVFRSADAVKGRAFLGLDNAHNSEGERILLVLGGSQGAREINELIRAALPELIKHYIVAHQTGPNLSWDLPASERYKPFPFFREEMPHVMAAAELILGRSGAGIWEWAVAGKPMILVPLCGSGTRGDQIENARFFYQAGAAIVLHQSVQAGEEASPQALIRAVNSLAVDSEKRTKMACSSSKIGERDGAKLIACVLTEAIK
ncbi:MAG: undecaprenyldiphospho-muramoylpentapeptide beta-N-acetylglucosaminyltransferase [Treponema sp.]|nr:undecaprenyldiphospho-muramoylpentapeptide beta-N-acetylglucosaminyltransferase [Treponema sp.]